MFIISDINLYYYIVIGVFLLCRKMPARRQVDFKRHEDGTVNEIFISTGRAEPAMAAKRNKFQITEFGAAIHGTVRGGTIIKHLIDVFDNQLTRIHGI